MKETRFNFKVSNEVYEDFKLIMFLRKTTITKSLTAFVKSVIKEEKEMLNTMKKARRGNETKSNKYNKKTRT